MSRWLRIWLGLWAGLLLWLMILVAPSLFAELPDRALAGALAGALFRWATWVSVGSGILLAVFTARAGSWRGSVTLLVPGALLLVSELLVRPAMQAAKAQPGSGFAFWHGIASAIYVLATVLVLILWWRAEALAPLRRAE